MSSDSLQVTLQKDAFVAKKSIQPIEGALLVARLRKNIWFVGIPSWMIGIADRGLAAFADGYLSAIEIAQLFMAVFFFLSWLLLKPQPSGDDTLPIYDPEVNASASSETASYVEALQDRLADLQPFHMIRQEYILPFPYFCQIYHLLNLKHLEDVHHFSLNNLRILKVSDFQPTTLGGIIKFQTVLDSPINALRIWRQPIVEVELILHTPCTVELSIPVYNGRRIIVMFNAVPTGDDEHKLFIDIYSDLGWFKPLLQVVLHFASCLTLFEDLPYLRSLANRNISRLVKLGRISNHETMKLFKRFVDLYGAGISVSDQLNITSHNNGGLLEGTAS
ncbi:MAG TPA: hypothetical protein V6C78_01655 [Crinalium sp.]|jgi:hypothetical protein